MINTCNDRVLLIDNEDHKKTASGIIIESTNTGVSVKKLVIKQWQEFPILVGCKAVIGLHNGVAFDHDGEKLISVNDKEILAIIENDIVFGE